MTQVVGVAACSLVGEGCAVCLPTSHCLCSGPQHTPHPCIPCTAAPRDYQPPLGVSRGSLSLQSVMLTNCTSHTPIQHSQKGIDSPHCCPQPGSADFSGFTCHLAVPETSPIVMPNCFIFQSEPVLNDPPVTPSARLLYQISFHSHSGV